MTITGSGGSARPAMRALFLVAAMFAAAPVCAQSVGSARDQPTPATIPGYGTPAERPSGNVAPPSAIRSGVEVMAPESKGGSRATTTIPTPEALSRDAERASRR